MVGIEDVTFPELDPGALAAYAEATAADLGLAIPDAFLPAVMQTLAALQTHAAILAAALEGADGRDSRLPAS
jgi:hypothetical protein